MELVVVPILKDKLEAWKNWASALKTSKKEEFDDLNRRYGLTRHEAWLAETPNGPMAVVLHEGPGADTFMEKVMHSENSVDKAFGKSVAEFHGMDPNSPPPGPMPIRVL
jgi:hypothetical protein